MSLSSDTNYTATKEEMLRCLYDKTNTCPVCSAHFKERTIRQKEIRLLTQDTDLKSYYKPVDPINYDILLCPKCGYAALTRTFQNISLKQSQAILTKISPQFKQPPSSDIYTDDIAIIRYQQALDCAEAKKVKAGEIAYLYMRLAWIYRSKEDRVTEKEMLTICFDRYIEAMSVQNFPIMELDEHTLLYLLGDIAYRIGKQDETKLYFSKVIGNQYANPRLKERISSHPIMQREAY